MAHLDIRDYTYDLPQEKIALYPSAQRDESNLLVYRQGNLMHARFKELSAFLPPGSFLFFNDTRVIPARLHFKKETGAVIEIFLLSPVSPSPVLSETMASTETCSWKCTIGNLKRWPDGTTLMKKWNDTGLSATLINREEGIVAFRWTNQRSFAGIIQLTGETPLPPYLKRGAEASDRERYQTIYSHYAGAVAAPTAGLHFTDSVFGTLREKNIHHDFLTLHVSAGTFQPIKSENAEEHVMHSEQIIVTEKNIDNLLLENNFVIAVGTTSLRTLESIYWFGAKLLINPESDFVISQNDPYQYPAKAPDLQEAILAVKKFFGASSQKVITGETSIFIKPGYDFKVCRGLITNFHQPASTLILLVAAFVGNDWKKIYREALTHNYRFLSFGDSSLLLPDRRKTNSGRQ